MRASHTPYLYYNNCRHFKKSYDFDRSMYNVDGPLLILKIIRKKVII